MRRLFKKLVSWLRELPALSSLQENKEDRKVDALQYYQDPNRKKEDFLGEVTGELTKPIQWRQDSK